MLSGIIKIGYKEYPLTWSGEKAWHVATMYIEQRHIHPFLHIEIQQMARKGELYYTENSNRFLSFSKNNDWVVALLRYAKFVVICGAAIVNIKDIYKIRQIKKKGAVGYTKKKKEKVAIDEIEFSDDTVKGIENLGFTVNELRRAMYSKLNGKKPLNKKR